MSQLTESPYKWDFGKKVKMSELSRFVKILEFFQFRIQLMSIGGLTINKETDFHYYFQRHDFIDLAGKI